LDDIRLLLTALSAEAGGWPAGVAARRDVALLLMGFAGAHRRSELVALTLEDITLPSTDGLHVRLRRSKTDQEAHGTVKALPPGRDPVTCPPCAYVRWRQVLQAWDRTVLRRQATTTGIGGGEDGADLEVQHCCRGARLLEPADPTRALFPRVHATGAIGATAMTGHAVNEMIHRRAAAGFTPAQVDKLGGHSLRVTVRTALGRPTGEPFHPTEADRDAVQAALRGLPSHGWTAGMFGRRDRCLLVLSQLAGVPYQHLATLTAGGLQIEEGVATIRSPAGEWTLRPAGEAILCGPCAVVRWLKILDLAVTKPSTKTISGAMKKAAVVDHRSPHVCLAGPVLGETTRTVPLLPPIDQWGALPSRSNDSHRTQCPAAPATSSPGTSARTVTCPSTPTRNQRRPRRSARRSSSPPPVTTSRRMQRQRGTAAAGNCRTWPGSSRCSATSSAPTS